MKDFNTNYQVECALPYEPHTKAQEVASLLDSAINACKIEPNPQPLAGAAEGSFLQGKKV